MQSEKAMASLHSADSSLPLLLNNVIRPNKKISVFRVTGLKILGREGTYIFFNHFFFLENI